MFKGFKVVSVVSCGRCDKIIVLLGVTVLLGVVCRVVVVLWTVWYVVLVLWIG